MVRDIALKSEDLYRSLLSLTEHETQIFNAPFCYSFSAFHAFGPSTGGARVQFVYDMILSSSSSLSLLSMLMTIIPV